MFLSIITITGYTKMKFAVDNSYVGPNVLYQFYRTACLS